MLVKMETGASGGNGQIFCKNLTPSDWTNYEVTLGFKPKNFLITNPLSSNTKISALYDEEVSDSNVNLNWGTENIPSYAISSFCTITEDGISLSGKSYSYLCGESNVMLLAVG